MSVLVSGSLAIDHIMVFEDRFRNHILPEKLHLLNVAFYVPSLEKTFGGTGGNIAYHLRLLGESPLLVATVGSDFGTYREWLEGHGVDLRYVRVLPDTYTAQAFITTDLDDNQITAFHPGAMERAHEARIEEVDGSFRIGIVSPNGKRAMREHAAFLKARGIPVVVDPGQQLPQFAAEELVELFDGASLYVVNDYEWSLTLERTGLTEAEILRRVGAVVVTRGEKGQLLLREGSREEIPATRAERVVDPTGCGDAFRAGLLAGQLRGLSLEDSARLGGLLGALKVAHRGTQGLRARPGEILERARRELGVPLQP